MNLTQKRVPFGAKKLAKALYTLAHSRTVVVEVHTVHRCNSKHQNTKNVKGERMT